LKNVSSDFKVKKYIFYTCGEEGERISQL